MCCTRYRHLNRHRADVRAMQRFRMRRRHSLMYAMRESVCAVWEFRWPDLLP